MPEFLRTPEEVMNELQAAPPKDLHPMLPENMRASYRELTQEYARLEKVLEDLQTKHGALAELFNALGQAVETTEGPGAKELKEKVDSLDAAMQDVRADYEAAEESLTKVNDELGTVLATGQDMLKSINSRGGQA